MANDKKKAGTALNLARALGLGEVEASVRAKAREGAASAIWPAYVLGGAALILSGVALSKAW